MIHRTLSDAQAVQVPASWKQLCIVRVALSSGIEFFRTYIFDTTRDACKRCRKARNQFKAIGNDGGRRRLACTGHTCEQCGNPFAAFTRQGRLGDRLSPGNPHATNEGWWTEGGRLH